MSRSRRPSSEIPITPEKQARQVRGRSVASSIQTIQRKIKIPSSANSNKSKSKYANFAQVLLWPFKFLSSTYNWLYMQAIRSSDIDITADNVNVEDEVISFLPSILTFAVGLVIIKYFEEPIDSMFSSFMSGTHRVVSSLEEVYDTFSCDEFENIARLFFVVLFWIGGFRIVSNLTSKIFRATRPHACYKKKMESDDA